MYILITVIDLILIKSLMLISSQHFICFCQFLYFNIVFMKSFVINHFGGRL